MLRAAKLPEDYQALATPVTAQEHTQTVAPDDLEYVSETSAAMLQQAPTGGRLILWFTVLFIAVALVWAANAKLDEVTRGHGLSTLAYYLMHQAGLISRFKIPPQALAR